MIQLPPLSLAPLPAVTSPVHACGPAHLDTLPSKSTVGGTGSTQDPFVITDGGKLAKKNLIHQSHMAVISPSGIHQSTLSEIKAPSQE